MTQKIMFQFPGQGSQAVGMGGSLAEAFPVARAAFELLVTIVCATE